jgi:hypothetical protein
MSQANRQHLEQFEANNPARNLQSEEDAEILVREFVAAWVARKAPIPTRESLWKKTGLMLPWSLMGIPASPGANLAHLRNFPISITEKKLSPK